MMSPTLAVFEHLCMVFTWASFPSGRGPKTGNWELLRQYLDEIQVKRLGQDPFLNEVVRPQYLDSSFHSLF